MPEEERLEEGGAADVADVALREAGRLAGRDAELAPLERGLGDDRLDRLVDVLEAEAEAAGDDAHRLREADVPRDRLVCDLGREVAGGETEPEPPQDRRAEAGEVDHPLDADRPHVGEHPRAREHEGVEGEAGVEAGAEDADVLLAGERVEPAGELVVEVPRVGGLLGGGDDVRAGLDRAADVGPDVSEE